MRSFFTRGVMLLAGLALCIAQSAFALTINTYTNQATWQAATGGNIGLVDFNAEAITSFSTTGDFGPFTATSTGPNIAFRIAPGAESGNIDGTNFLQLSSGNHLEEMLWTFDTPITALGFKWANTDFSRDKIELRLDSQQFTFGIPMSAGGPGSGFFGLVITDGMVTSMAALSDTLNDGGFLSYGGFDNVQFATPTPPPNPAPGC